MADGVKHFLYLLPDVAYAIELVANKDGNGYVIRDYLQVNGEFMDDNIILPESMEKLANKLQPQAYDLILPDFLFTNTVVNVEATGEEAVKKHVDEKLMPNLELSPETHGIQSFVLTERKGQSKVQLSALEYSVLDPVKQALGGDHGPSIHHIYPLSWTLKSLISLEPSISIVQMGGNLYLAQHYIGVDQANNASAEDAEKLVETVKTLKGAEPSIQTLYLLSSMLVENKLRAGLKATLPMQQLASDSEESEMPSYVKQVVEAGAKTLSVADYKVPVFIMGTGISSAAIAAKETQPKEAMNKDEDTAAEKTLPTPTEVGTEPATADEMAKKQVLEFADEPAAVAEKPSMEKKPAKPEAVDLAQFSDQTEVDEEAEPAKPMDKKADEPMKTMPVMPPRKPIIKNERGVNSMVRMIVICLISFFVTVGIGLGIGLGLLTFTKPSTPEQTVEPTPTVEVTPTPTPTPTINRADYDVLVVNATTTAGLAGVIADKLETAGFEDVAAQNAKGDYETGNYVLMAEDNPELVSLLSGDTGLILEFAEGKALEDADDTYTLVIVLAE